MERDLKPKTDRRLLGAVILILMISTLFMQKANAVSAPGSDYFDHGTLGSQWSWVREDSTHWSLAAQPGSLRITSQTGTISGATDTAKNLLVQNAPAGDWSIITKLTLSSKPAQNKQQAGLLVYVDDSNYIRINRMYDSGLGGNRFDFVKEINGTETGAGSANDTIVSTTVYLKIVKAGTIYSGYFSADSVNYTKIGSDLTATLSSPKVGLFAYNGTGAVSELNADFDFVSILTTQQESLIPLTGDTIKIADGLDIDMHTQGVYAGTFNWTKSLTDLKLQGITSFHSYVRWFMVERYEGEWDWGHYDEQVEGLKRVNLQWQPWVLIGPSYANADWFKNSADHVGYQPVEGGAAQTTESIWNPNFRKYVDYYWKRFAEKYGSQTLPDGRPLLQSVAVGFPSVYGETVFAFQTNDWVENYSGTAYSTNYGTWQFDDPYAKQDFRNWLQTKYGTIAALNTAWSSAYANFGQIDTFIPATDYTLTQVPDPTKNKRARKDLMDWYKFSLVNFVDFTLERARHHMPNARLETILGGSYMQAGFASQGVDVAGIARVSAKHSAGIRVTSLATEQTAFTSTATRFYKTFMSIEPLAASEFWVTRHLFLGAANNAYGLMLYDRPWSGAESHVNNLKAPPNLTSHKPYVDVAYFSATTTFDFVDDWYPDPLVGVVNHDIIDDESIMDGILDNYRVVVTGGNITTELTVINKLLDWIKSGGILIRQAGTPGDIKTIEGTVPFDFKVTQQWGNGKIFYNYNISDTLYNAPDGPLGDHSLRNLTRNLDTETVYTTSDAVLLSNDTPNSKVFTISGNDYTVSPYTVHAVAHPLISVLPVVTSLTTGATKNFTAMYNGNDATHSVTWYVNNIVGGNSTVGTISSGGVYTAPAAIPNPDVVTVKAVLNSDPTKSITASVGLYSSVTANITRSATALTFTARPDPTPPSTFTDNFSAGSGNWTPYSGIWSVASQVYKLNAAGGFGRAIISGLTRRNFDMSLKINVEQTMVNDQNYAGVMLRFTSPAHEPKNSGYLVKLMGDGTVGLYEGGTGLSPLKTIATASTGYVKNTWANVRIVLSDVPTQTVKKASSRLLVYVDDVLYIDVRVNTFADPGYVGLCGEEVQASFDDVSIDATIGSIPVEPVRTIVVAPFAQIDNPFMMRKLDELQLTAVTTNQPGNVLWDFNESAVSFQDPNIFGSISASGLYTSSGSSGQTYNASIVAYNEFDSNLVGFTWILNQPARAEPTHDVLHFSATTSSSADADKYVYRAFSDVSRTIRPHDIFSYDVKLGSNIGGLGGIEIEFTDGTKVSAYADWKDQNQLSGSPKANLADYANGAWYRRYLRFPQQVVGKTIAKFHVAAENDAQTVQTFTADIDNVAIYNNGQEVLVAYRGGTPSLNQQQTPVGYTASSITITSVGDYAAANHDVLRFEGTTDSSSATNNKYAFHKFSNASHTFQSGDVIEYDVHMEANTSGLGGNGLGGIDIVTTDGTILRNLVYSDSNGVSGHPANDIGFYASDRWYHRKLTVPAGMIGKTISEWYAVMENNSVSTTFKVDYDNVKITNGGATVATAYLDGAPSLNVSAGGAHYSATTISVRNIGQNGASGDKLQFDASTNNSISNSRRAGIRFSTTNYVLQAGDYIEYDVKLLHPFGGMGGLDFLTATGERLSAYDVKDQSGISASPAANIANLAYDVWYHRKIAVPVELIGKTVDYWIAANYFSGQSTNLSSQYDNIKVTNGGAVQLTVWSTGPLNLSNLDAALDYDGYIIQPAP